MHLYIITKLQHYINNLLYLLTCNI